MKIKILGTRGEIEEYSKAHKKHSGILIDNILFDIGEKEYLKYNPKAIFITHFHPDHAFFSEDAVEALDYTGPIYGPEQFRDWINVIKSPVKIGQYSITPIPTAHSKKVKSNAYLIQSNKTRILYTGDMMWILKKYHDKIKNVDLVITEASSYDRNLIRKDPKTGERYGHKSLKDIVQFFRRLGTKQIVVTHYGKWLVENPKRGYSKIKALGNDIKVIPAKDDMEIELTSLQLKPEDVRAIIGKEIAKIKTGLYLVPPHGELIWKGDKTLIVKSKKFTEHIKEEMYLLSDGYCYGIIYLEEPKEITKEEFDRLVDKHKISQEEYEEWGWKEPLYAYEFRFRKYDEPLPVKLPRGIQVFVDANKIKWLTPQIMDDKELLLRHLYCHIYKSGCLHHRIVHELENRGYPHAIRELIDRKYELIKDIRKYNPADVSDKQLGYDWAIVLDWWSRLLKGKPFKYTKKEVYSLAKKIFKAMIKRRFEFNKPETYKAGARDLFTKLIRDIGEDKILWKEQFELYELPPGMGIEDIDIQYVIGLTDEELIELHNWLHNQYKEYGLNEPLQNAHIFVGIELLKRGLEDHKEAKDKLDEETQLEIIEYPTPGGVASEIIEEEEPEGEYITLEEVLDAFPQHIVVGGQPYAAYLTGRIVNEGKIPKDHDIDIVFRQEADPRIPVFLHMASPKWLTKRLHYVSDPSGPLIGYSMPILRYGFFKVKREDMIKGFGPYRKILLSSREVKPFMRFRALKAKAGWMKNEFWKYDDLWNIWASKYIDRGIIVQKKYDGRRFIIHKEGDKVQIITEDRQRDRSNQLPRIVKELQSINHDFVIDTEAVGYDCKGKLVKSAKLKEESCEEIPREDTAELTVGKIPPEAEEGYVFHIHDLLYLDGKSLNSLPYSERFSKLRTIFPDKYQYLRVVVSSPVLTTPGQFRRWLQKLRTMKGSEGVMAKVADSQYPIKAKGENRTPEWAKLKNLKSIDVIVWKVVPKTYRTGPKKGQPIPGQYMYECAIAIPKSEIKNWRPKDLVEVKNKIYAKIGRTFATAVKASIGNIVEVLVGRIREYIDKKTGKHYITWMFPRFRDKRLDKKEPDNLETARRLAKVGPEAIEKMVDKTTTVLLQYCPYYRDKSICPLRIRFGKPRIHMSILRVQYLKYPIACPLASRFRCVYLKEYYYGLKEWRRIRL